MQRITKSSTTYYKALVALFIGSLIAFGAEYCVQPVIPIIAKEFNLMPTSASLAVTVGLGGMATAMVGIAFLSTRLYRRYTMIVGLLGALVLAVGIAMTDSFIAILIMRLVQGILLAGFPAMAIAYIQEEFDPSIIATTVGVYVSGSSVGGLAGRFILSALTDVWGWRMALLLLVLFYALLSICFIYLLPKEKHPLQKGTGWERMVSFVKEVLRNRSCMIACSIAPFIMGTCVCTYNFISYVLLAPPYEWSQTSIGFVYALYLLGTLSSTLMGRLADATSNRKSFQLSTLFMIGGLLISTGLSPWLKLIGIGLYTFGFFGAHSTACSWTGKLDTGDNKATISALYMLFFYIGASLFGTLGGLFLQSFGWIGVVGFNCALTCIGLFLSVKV